MPAFSPQNILLQINTENPAQPVLDCALALAQSHGAKLKIVDVVLDQSWFARQMTSGIQRAIENITHAKSDHLKALASDLANRGAEVSTKVLDAPSSVAIVREVLRDGHDLVVRATKGSASRRSGFFGTTATRLLRKCPCPLMLLKPDHAWQTNRVVAAVDATTEDEVHAELNGRILESARGFCPDLHKLDVICAWTIYGESVVKGHMRPEEFDLLAAQTKALCERRLDNLVLKLGMGIGWDNVRVLHGAAAEVIPSFIAEHHSDLLVLGTIARSGIAGILIGNTAESILDQVECSVLAVKPAGFVSPIRL